MHLSASDVISKQFHDQWRGYSQPEVDDFLDRVAETLDAVQRENVALQTRIHELDQAVSTSRETEEMLKKTLVTAQQAAEKAIATAKEKAELLITEAEERVQQVNADADERVQKAQAEVKQRAMDAQRQYDLRKRELDSTIEKLASYESELKTRLKTFLEQEKQYLEQQLQALEKLSGNGARPAPVPPPSPSTAARHTQAPPSRLQTQPLHATPSRHAIEDEANSDDAEAEPTANAPARRTVRSLFWRDDS